MRISKGARCCRYFFCCLKSHQLPGRTQADPEITFANSFRVSLEMCTNRRAFKPAMQHYFLTFPRGVTVGPGGVSAHWAAIMIGSMEDCSRAGPSARPRRARRRTRPPPTPGSGPARCVPARPETFGQARPVPVELLVSSHLDGQRSFG